MRSNQIDDTKSQIYKDIAEDQLWLSVDVVDLAEQLTLYESNIFCEMNCSSLAHQNMEQSSLRFVIMFITIVSLFEINILLMKNKKKFQKINKYEYIKRVNRQYRLKNH
jgi:hypothetical protein